jgi:peptidoglycan hydrolase-like protein with peptidoglycan-binding domain
MKVKALCCYILVCVLAIVIGAVAQARVLKPGDKGEDVRKWQLFLIHRMFMQEPAYGNFAERTTQGTKRFQKQHGLKQTGLFDAATEKKARSLGFVPCAGKRNRLGKYVYTRREGGGKRVWYYHNIIELKPNGVAVIRNTVTGIRDSYSSARSCTGTYKMQGDEVIFSFTKTKKSFVMFETGLFQGATLFTYMHIMEEYDDPGDHNPQFPDGYPHKKQ